MKQITLALIIFSALTIHAQNVGIGTTIPNYKLDVAGDVNSNAGFKINGTAASGAYLRGNGSDFVSSAIQPSDVPAGSGNYIENQTSQQSPGNFNISGSGVVAGTLTAGNAIMGTGISGGYYQDGTNGAYRSIVSSGTNNGYYFQSNGGASTTMWVGLGGPYLGNVGIGTAAPAATLDVYGTNIDMYSRSVIQDDGDGWLRLNQNGSYSNGIYSPGFLRVDGGIGSGGVGSLGSGTINATGQIRGDIFYDYYNTGYYVQPRATSYVNNMRFNTADCLNGTCPPNGAVRMTPNFHFNAGQHYAVIVNWDNGNSGSDLTFRVGNGSGTDIFDIQAGGSVGIGTTGPAEKLDVNGFVKSNGYRCLQGSSGTSWGNIFNFYWVSSHLQAWIDVTNLGNVTYTSDRRLKDRIRNEQDGAISRVMSLRPVKFFYKKIEGTIFDGDPLEQEGFIADELQQIIPSAVNGEKDALTSKGTIQPQTLNVGPIVSVLTKAVQEQQRQIESLSKEVETLRSMLSNK